MDEKILSKLKKLLALAESDNVHEAAAAAARAQELMAKYQIDTACLDASAPAGAPAILVENDYLEPAKRNNARKELWKGSIAAALAKANGCQSYWEGANLRVIGTRASAETVRYLYAYLVREVDRLAAQNKGNGRAWINSFRIGAAHEISGAIRDGRQQAIEAAQSEAMARMKADPVNHGSALALVTKGISRLQDEARKVSEFTQQNLRLKPGRSAKASSGDGYYRGREAGATVKVGSGPGLGRGTAGTLRQ